MLFPHLTVVLDTEPHAAALNMAIDETLLRHAAQPTLRLYGWASPAVSFGYFGAWIDALAAGSGREIVRRWTGGGIVLHGHDFTCSLIVPRADPFFAVGPRESYCAIHRCIAAALGNATLAVETPPKISTACFQNPVQHDVLVATRKVAGGAQRRTKHGLLHQGSIQSETGAAALTAALPFHFAPRCTIIPLAAEIEAEARQLALEKYALDRWNQRL